MFEIVDRQELAQAVTLYEIKAPRIAQRHKAGQFVMIRPTAGSERIPLTVADTDIAKGTITLVVQAVGKTTQEMSDKLNVGDALHNVAGPLGTPTHIGLPGRPDEELGTVVCVAGGIGAAPILPIARTFRKKGHEVVTILGARRADLLILQDRLEKASSRVIICTDDGTAGRKGFVTDVLKDFIQQQRSHGDDVHAVVAIGPPIMMKFVSVTTKPFAVPTLVSLNTIMVDGTGMCGGCRVMVGGEVKYVCVDGPEFDGHKVDFDGMMRRQAMYRKEEAASLERYKCDGVECKAVAAAILSEGEPEKAGAAVAKGQGA